MARPIDPEKRPAILNAARRVFLTKGYANTRMSEIAASAKVAVGTVYLYFQSKDAIAQAMAETFYSRIDSVVFPAIESAIAEGMPPEAFRQMIHDVFSVALQEKELILLAPGGFADVTSLAPETTDDRGAFLHRLGTALAALMAAGRVRRYEDPTVLATLIVTACQPVIRTYISLSEHDRERYEAVFTDFLESALLNARPATSHSESPHAKATPGAAYAS